MSANDKKWHVDKTVPIALIVGLIIQTAGLLISAGVMWQRIEFTIATQVRQEARLGNVERAQYAQDTAFAELKGRISNIEAGMSEIKGMLQVRPTYSKGQTE